MILVDLLNNGKLSLKVVQENPQDSIRLQNLPSKEIVTVNGVMEFFVPYEDISLVFQWWEGEIIPSIAAENLYKRYLWGLIPNTELEPIPVEGQYFSRPPKDHQIGYILNSLLRPRSNDYAGMGGGKSYAALERARRFPFTRMLIVGPANVVSLKRKGWYNEVKLAYGEAPLMYRGTPEQRAKLDILSHRFVLVSYDLAGELDPYLFDSYIFDEFHLASNHKTKRAKSLVPLINASWRAPTICFQVLTGTPIGNTIETFWATQHAVAPLLAGSYEAFKYTHQEVTKTGCRTIYTENGDGEVRARKVYYTASSKLKNPELFEQKMQATARRVSQDEIMKFKRSIRYVEGNLTELQRELYDNCRLNLLEEGASKRLNLKNGEIQMLRLLQISEGPFNLKEEFPEHCFESWKLDYVIRAILYCIKHKLKLVVWSRFSEGIEILHKMFPEYSVLWRGTVSKAGKDAALTAFSGDDGDPEVRAEYEKYAKKHGWVFAPGEALICLGVMNIQSTLGINLQSAYWQIFMSYSLSVITNVQTAARIIRLDQIADEVITDVLVSNNTWEKQLYVSLLNKWKESEQALYGKEVSTKNAYSQLLRLLKSGGTRAEGRPVRGADRLYAPGAPGLRY